MPFRLATLKLFGQSLSGNKKIAPKHNASKQFLVRVVIQNFLKKPVISTVFKADE